METDYYRQIFEFFNEKEELNSATYDVLINEIYDIQKLQSIEVQRHLLNVQEKFFLDVLQQRINVQRFFNENSIYGYITLDYIDKVKMSWRCGEYDGYKKAEPCFNMRKDEFFISSFMICDEIWFFEHTSMLCEKEVEWLQLKIVSINDSVKALYDEIEWDKFIEI